jgi:hypothetical protein
MANKTLRYLAVVTIGLSLLLYFLPNVLYLGDRVGLHAADSKDTLGISVETENGWYALAASNTALGKLLIPSTMSPTVLYYKNSWLTPWSSDMAFVSKYDIPSDPASRAALFASVKMFRWGEAGLVKVELTRTPNRQLALLPEFGVGVSAVNLDMLADIRRIARP